MEKPPILLHTPLHATHLRSKARMADFAGWDMPIHYGSQIEEHQAVRSAAGMFDVSHMLAIDLTGPDATAWLRRLLANDVVRLTAPGKALYSCLLRKDGGIIDDLIVYFFDPTHYRIVVNAGTADKDLAWMQQHAAGFDIALAPRRDLAMIAIQGPQAREKFWQACPDSRAASEGLASFQAAFHGDWLIARTGYTGEDGLEIALPAEQAATVWTQLEAAGVRPCGLGCRDTLRLEAGMNLYGQDMDESISPLEAGLAWTLAMQDERDFIGKTALLAQRPARRLTGLLLQERGVLRAHQTVKTAHGNGEITSGSFSPTLQQGIALARLPAAVAIGDSVEVDIRGKWLQAKVVKPPFVRHGQRLFS
ncbi:aminomethyltransferase, tetrahydrofolate-dependent, subunit (T protein) of glycine cleavage complex [Sterolibacterium denitrificans]|uniref:Aminomethyltransferase, tetrahydrofolate-dependent, subunit (T protein) of glycine cleavage complex n=2 Tax=Sterolibacterium denitrificans TaxID=157592 RepID=A0A7Z7MWC9_9PROT|nr:glycine cleavage system aminomethyltransferase GcvT [Sterolibacterium denitrificans]KYC29207.1 glycine cleavage system protein T [Sterolibacterium denitrificans]SMB29635.1 aminomethyltransferase, tetrahydrofolate-dependent, subunit (T protein) of glycine cleavage complex [Sterolibacterium denitrificans]